NPQGFKDGFDPSPGNFYVLTIQATDNHGEYTTQKIVLHVDNVNEAPTITNAPSVITVDDPITASDVIVDLNATDPDAGQNVTWSISQNFNVGNQHGFMFNINSTTGELTFNGSLDVFGDQPFFVRVQADDGNGGITTADIKVILHDTFVNT